MTSTSGVRPHLHIGRLGRLPIHRQGRTEARQRTHHDRTPCSLSGIGKPEQLEYHEGSALLCRIPEEHRVVYSFDYSFVYSYDAAHAKSLLSRTHRTGVS
ncbi:MAG: type II toxin-antitoxin system YoeB family toxin [Cryobacterium sp.]|nr:type II toxin-antitoxin system YoeB family toxin [Cryobacterium sp.]MCY7404237.1 type II toxin-antitoxin system YoeB family toxin [Cryobacterium sp.]